MATPINSKSQQTSGAQSLGADLLARLQANAQGEAASSGAFNAWMSKHALSADDLQAQPQPTKPAAAGTAAPQRDPNSTAARLLEQALNRARQQTLAAQQARPAQPSAQPQAATAAAGSASAQGAKPAQASGNQRSERKDEDKDAAQARSEAGGAELLAGKAAEAEDEAVVNELTPPPGVKTDDAQAMMAWLASLTHGDMTHGLKPAPKQAAGSDRATEGTSASEGSDSLRTLAGVGGREGQDPANQAGTIDLVGWQAVAPSTAQLQGEGAFKDELSARIEAKGADALGAGLNLRAAPELKGAAAVATESATLQAPVGSPDFAQALGDQLTMWVKNVPEDGMLSAELHLNPAEMGPIHVKISLEGKEARVDFAAAAVETRQALEASMTSLSTAFTDVGLNLTGGVSAQTAQQAFQQGFGQPGGQGGDAGRGQGRGAEPQAGEPDGSVRAVAAPRPGHNGGLDLYA